jgi:hypothetical protein
MSFVRVRLGLHGVELFRCRAVLQQISHCTGLVDLLLVGARLWLLLCARVLVDPTLCPRLALAADRKQTSRSPGLARRVYHSHFHSAYVSIAYNDKDQPCETIASGSTDSHTCYKGWLGQSKINGQLFISGFQLVSGFCSSRENSSEACSCPCRCLSRQAPFRGSAIISSPGNADPLDACSSVWVHAGCRSCALRGNCGRAQHGCCIRAVATIVVNTEPGR